MRHPYGVVYERQVWGQASRPVVSKSECPAPERTSGSLVTSLAILNKVVYNVGRRPNHT